MQLTTMDSSETLSGYLISVITSVPLGKVKSVIDELADWDWIAMPQIVFNPGALGQYILSRIDAELVIKEVRIRFGDLGQNCFGNYVVNFYGSERVKIGITKNFDKRMTYYEQEAQRHGLGYISHSFFPTFDESISRDVERGLIKEFELHAVPKTREWFLGGSEMDSNAIFSTISRIAKIKSAALERSRQHRERLKRTHEQRQRIARLTGRDYPQITGGLVTA